jgi:hypothetical protein
MVDGVAAAIKMAADNDSFETLIQESTIVAEMYRFLRKFGDDKATRSDSFYVHTEAGYPTSHPFRRKCDLRIRYNGQDAWIEVKGSQSRQGKLGNPTEEVKKWMPDVERLTKIAVMDISFYFAFIKSVFVSNTSLNWHGCPIHDTAYMEDIMELMYYLQKRHTIYDTTSAIYDVERQICPIFWGDGSCTVAMRVYK